jgi:hypothetical protein
MRSHAAGVRVGLLSALVFLPLSSGFAQVVMPDMGDMNCDGISNVVDVPK